MLRRVMEQNSSDADSSVRYYAGATSQALLTEVKLRLRPVKASEKANIVKNP